MTQDLKNLSVLGNREEEPKSALDLVLEAEPPSMLDQILEEPQPKFVLRKGSVLDSYELTLGKHKHSSGLKPKQGKELQRDIKKKPKHYAKLKAKREKNKARGRCLTYRRWVRLMREYEQRWASSGGSGSGSGEIVKTKVVAAAAAVKPKPLPPICPECGGRHN